MELTPDFAQALRRVAARARCAGHLAARALDAFDGDEERAVASLVDDVRVGWADASRWIADRLGLVVDDDAADARKVGTRANVAFVGARPDLTPAALADRLALVVGGFPIADGWLPVTLAQAEADLAFAIGHDLAYQIVRRSPASARARARRFLAAAGPDAIALTNSQPFGGTSRGWSTVTLATFDYAVVVIGTVRAGVVILTGED